MTHLRCQTIVWIVFSTDKRRVIELGLAAGLQLADFPTLSRQGFSIGFRRMFSRVNNWRLQHSLQTTLANNVAETILDCINAEFNPAF